MWVDTIEKTFNYDVSFDFSDRASSDPAFTLNDGFQWNPDGIISRYHNPQMSQLLAKAASTLDRAKRRPLYWQFQTLWNQNLYGIEHGKRDTVSASTKRVGGFIENPAQYRNFRYTYISK